METDWKQTLHEKKSWFNIAEFRGNQEAAMVAILEGYDVMLLMPTGGGKSLTYQLPAICSMGLTVVISPLISLITDQVDYLTRIGIPAAMMTSLTPADQLATTTADLLGHKTLKLVYITPERMASPYFISILRNAKHVDRFVIDECHCVSKWGNDFRPDYQMLSNIRVNFPLIPIMALTATATIKVKEDIISTLGFNTEMLKVLQSSFNRPNIRYSVMEKLSNTVVMEMFTRMRRNGFLHQSGIVYCFSRQDCEDVARGLNQIFDTFRRTEQAEFKGVFSNKTAPVKFANFYHAQIPNRDEVQQAWMSGETKVMCATIAFGMGINNEHVRYVYHHTMPQSIEGYYQESGRAGRDGEPAESIIWFNQSDISKIRFILTNNQKTNEDRQKKGFGNVTQDTVDKNLASLKIMTTYCECETHCRRVMQLKHFGERFDPARCDYTCDNCGTARATITSYYKRKIVTDTDDDNN